MSLERVGHSAFGVTCDVCHTQAPTVVSYVADPVEALFASQLDAVEEAMTRGFVVRFRVGPGKVVLVTRCLCSDCSHLDLN